MDEPILFTRTESQSGYMIEGTFHGKYCDCDHHPKLYYYDDDGVEERYSWFNESELHRHDNGVVKTFDKKPEDVRPRRIMLPFTPVAEREANENRAAATLADRRKGKRTRIVFLGISALTLIMVTLFVGLDLRAAGAFIAAPIAGYWYMMIEDWLAKKRGANRSEAQAEFNRCWTVEVPFHTADIMRTTALRIESLPEPQRNDCRPLWDEMVNQCEILTLHAHDVKAYRDLNARADLIIALCRAEDEFSASLEQEKTKAMANIERTVRDARVEELRTNNDAMAAIQARIDVIQR